MAIAVRDLVQPAAQIEAYKWKVRLPVPADAAAAEIRRVYEARGRIEPEDLVEAAADPDAVLHSCFEWDDAEAARERRIDQARYLLRMLVVVYRRADHTLTQPIRYVVNMRPERAAEAVEEDAGGPPAESNTYIPIGVVMSEAELRRRYVRQAFDDLQRWRDRYHDIDELARIFDAIERVGRELLAAG